MLDEKIPLSTVTAAPSAPVPARVLPDATGRFEGIQVLRFLAAFAVVVGHALLFTSQKFPVAPDLVELIEWGGGWSVTLFFCISGFVITHGAQELSASQFLAHRLTRIYPAYWLAILAVCVLKLALVGGLPLAEMSLLSSTLLPVGERPYPLWIEWSLIYEVFFYVLFAIAWIPRSNRTVLIVMSVWLALIVACALRYPDWASARYPTPLQILFSSRSVPFICGVFCYYLRQNLTPGVRAVLITLFPAGLAGIVILPGTDLKVASSAIAAASLLGVVVSRPKQPDRNSLLVKLGDYSYGIYLVHIAVITVLLSVGYRTYQNPWLVMLAGTAAGTAAGAVFGFFELKMYRRLKRVIDARFARRLPLVEDARA
jgi:peptidoglycan/LPS O-acetylase OafA/YrhL